MENEINLLKNNNIILMEENKKIKEENMYLKNNLQTIQNNFNNILGETQMKLMDSFNMINELRSTLNQFQKQINTNLLIIQILINLTKI